MADTHEIDQLFMRVALEQAHLAQRAGEVPIGAVLALDERELARAAKRTITDGERKPSLIGIDRLMCRHAKFRPLASHGTP